MTFKTNTTARLGQILLAAALLAAFASVAGATVLALGVSGAIMAGVGQLLAD